MKKSGFTLAEVLVTLGIIGVISALTIPTFTRDTQSSKVGPLLGKARSQFEQATTAILQEAQSDSLSGAMLCPASTPSCTPDQRVSVINTIEDFMFHLGHYLKGSKKDSSTFQSSDGITYNFHAFDRLGNTSQFPHDVLINSRLAVDINGEQGQGKDAKDVFYFEIRNDGSLVPYGSADCRNANFGTWRTKCNIDAVPSDRQMCTAHIFENGLKVLYRY